MMATSVTAHRTYTAITAPCIKPPPLRKLEIYSLTMAVRKRILFSEGSLAAPSRLRLHQFLRKEKHDVDEPEDCGDKLSRLGSGQLVTAFVLPFP